MGKKKETWHILSKKIYNFERIKKSSKKNWLPFNKARKYARTLNLKSHSDWVLFCQKGKRPYNIPSHPERTYSENWKSWQDWLSNLKNKTRHRKVIPLKDLKRFARSKKIKSASQWRSFVKENRSPFLIPARPEVTYKEWKSWADFLGTKNKATYEIKYLPFREAKRLVRRKKISTTLEFKESLKKGRLKGIPSHPERTYSKQWKGFKDFLNS